MRWYQPLVIVSAFFLAFAVLLIPIIKENLGQVNAESLIFPLPAGQAGLPSESSVSAKLEATDYYLPYPGILPDHPLYWLKMARDRISLALIREPLVHFEKLLLFADKRIGAAEVLIKGRKFFLGVSTASKAEIYLERAVAEFEALQKQGQTTAILNDQIEKAVAKHKEVLGNLEKETTEEKGTLTSLREKTERLQEKLRQTLKK